MQILRTSICLVGLLFLAACEGNEVKETLGLNRDAPDEFTVVSRPPLSVPPEFNLRPPRPGEAPLGIKAEDKAKSLITGINSAGAPVDAVQTAQPANGAAASLLRKAGAERADSGIREKLGVDERTPLENKNAKTLMEQLSGKEKNEPTVDAKKEAERLRSNKDSGKPINEGDIPENKPENDSLIDRIF